MKKTVSGSIAYLLILTLALSSCKKETQPVLPDSPVPISLSTDQKALIGSENSFAFDIFGRVVNSSSPGDNLIISPMSISTALAMTLNGAEGETKDAMLTALRQTGMTADLINDSYKSISSALLSVDQRVLISLANSVWIENNFVVKKSFSDALTNFYNADAKSFDIKDPQVPGMVNAWIEGKTNGLIKNMIDNLDPSTVMLLINAIYFKGKWADEFDKNSTVPGTFYKPGGSNVTVPMMKKTAEYNFYRGSGFTMAEFPYGQGNYVMDVILPDSNDGTPGILSTFSNTIFNQWISQMAKTKIIVTFPRFKYGAKQNLNQILGDMGMSIAFTSLADFSGISDIPTCISIVLHQAFIETNEEGTEAAAATVVGIIATAVPLQTEFTMDHPFLWVIRETSTNTILFVGRVSDPSAG